MSSMVLARKYRPKGFDSMVGQGHVVQALSNALSQQRLHHAYLFTGTRGVGKTTVSRILAKSLNCVGPDGQGTITASPCGQCQPCRDIDAGRFVDYVELDAASNRGVEEISQLLEQAVYKPVVGRFKVYMIDEVHMLSNTAFNAMLKTLEEPPDYLKFVLATTDPQKVPVTVLSRCLQFNLRPMAAQTVHEHLASVLAVEGISFEPEALRLLARAARGSMRDAMSLSDQAIAFGGGQLQEATVRQMLGAVDRQHVQRLIEAVAACDGKAIVAAVDTLRQLGLSASGTLEELATALQRMAVIQAVPGLEDSEDPDELVWRGLAPLLAPDETQLFYSLCLQGRAELALAPDEYSGLLMLMLRLLAFKPGSGAGQGGSSLPKAEGSVRQQPRTEPVSSTLAQGAAPRQAPASLAARPEPLPVAASVSASGASAVGPVPVAAPVSSMAPAGDVAQRQPSAPVRAVESQGGGQSVPPWEALPPEADAALMAGEPASIGMPPEDAFVQEAMPEPAHRTQRQFERVAAPVAVSVSAPLAESISSAERAVSIELPPPGADPLSDRWADVVAQLNAKGAITALVRELAMQAQCVAQQDEGGQSMWRLRVDRESLCSETNRERLAQALAQVVSGQVMLELEKGPARNTPAQRDQVARERRQHQAEHLIESDPLVRSLLAQHPGARIVPGSIRPL
ncbi:DNA polymerase III subunits gamma and tau [Aquabacterium sp. NJ1]|uniref:DNA polymerase III subunit gamma/tau n=1 Tax=Aquabacterium sp. NJ1 TaxID=1538295 RepID=UPI00052BC3EC|nr:DNA polymerase III subunit gamma/tau [Aquabacterium sp. NJ1]KGM39157.1 DNA polymerase III subunits gamma and tau [Aquabacterium sp. NJ1]